MSDPSDTTSSSLNSAQIEATSSDSSIVTNILPETAANPPIDEKPKLSKWKLRKRLKPITKKSDSVTTSDKDFFSMGNKFNDNNEDEDEEENVDTNQKKEEEKVQKVKSNVVKSGIKTRNKAKDENVNESMAVLEDTAKLASTRSVEVVELSSPIELPSLSPPSLKRTKTEDETNVIILDDSSDIESTSKQISPSKASHIDGDPDPLETIRKMKLALKKRRNESLFKVRVNISCDMSTLGPSRSTILSMDSNEPFAILKQKYIDHCINDRLPYFDPNTVKLMIEATVIVWNDTLLSEDAVTPFYLGVTQGNPTMDITIMPRQDFEARQKKSFDKVLHQEEAAIEEIISDVAVTVEDSQSEPDDYFRIGLKDKDNAQFEVKVNKQTKIIKLIDFYRRKKGLPESSKIRMEFDDELLDIEGSVGETELEEDFTIDVYVS